MSRAVCFPDPAHVTLLTREYKIGKFPTRAAGSRPKLRNWQIYFLVTDGEGFSKADSSRSLSCLPRFSRSEIHGACPVSHEVRYTGQASFHEERGEVLGRTDAIYNGVRDYQLFPLTRKSRLRKPGPCYPLLLFLPLCKGGGIRWGLPRTHHIWIASSLMFGYSSIGSRR